MADYNDLIERLEKAMEGSRELDEAVAVAVGVPATMTVGDDLIVERRYVPMRCRPYTTSLDAALPLVPDGWAIQMAVCPENGAVVRTYWGPIREKSGGEVRARSTTPALALCTAALKARQAKEAPSHG